MNGGTLSYRIYNYSGETFRLAEIRGQESSTPPVSSARSIVVAGARDQVKGRCGRVIRRGPLGKPTL